MIQVTPQMRIVAAVEPADFRRGIDGLAHSCKDVLKHDPFNLHFLRKGLTLHGQSHKTVGQLEDFPWQPPDGGKRR